LSAADRAVLRYEAHAIEDLSTRIGNEEWQRNVRTSIMHALVQIDGDRAREILIDHLRSPESDLLPSALHFLRMIDADLAKREATALLEGSRGRALDGATLRELRRLSK